MPAPRVAPLRTGSGAEAMNDESLASFGVPLANARGRPPGSPDAICEERGPSSHVQYATDRKSTRLNSSHANISYAVFCLKKKNQPVARTPSPDMIVTPLTR